MKDVEDIFSLAGKTVLITGASSGFGAHFASVLGARGAQLVVAARRKDKLDELVNELRASDINAVAVQMDVTDPDAVEAALRSAEDHFGKVDILINNAGVSTDGKPFVAMDTDDWDFVLDTNVKGAVNVARAFAQRLLASKSPGVIVNIASMYGLGTGLFNAPYNVSKAAVVQLTKNMAVEFSRKNIRVNALCPGYFPTDLNKSLFSTEKGQRYIDSMVPQRLGKASELDGPLLLLASEASSYMTGSVLAVDGGTLLQPI